MDGKDLHVGDFAWGILPPAAPLGDRRADDRRHGAGVRARRQRPRRACRSSAKAARRSASGTRRSTCAPRAGCRRSSASQNNQTALSTPVARAVRGARVRRQGRRATASRASRSTAPIPTRSPRRSRGPPSARAPGAGPALIELVVDAHVRPRASRRHAVPRQGPAAVVGLSAAAPSRATPIRELYAFWSARDPIRDATRRGCEPTASSTTGDARPPEARGEAHRRGEARAVIDAPWPTRRTAGDGVFAGEAAARSASRCSIRRCGCISTTDPRSAAARSRRRRSTARAARFSKR